jgi:hypothetical protein
MTATFTLVCICLLYVVTICSSEQTLRGSEKIPTEKQPGGQRKHALSRPRLHYSSSAPHVANKYGVDLPAFAFDYSELFAGAVIERGFDSSELYLTISIVGHRAVAEDFPFHAISTDEEVMHAWSRAITKWDVTSRPPSYTPQSSSGLTCVVQNNDGSSGQVYHATAYWVHVQNETDPGSINNIFSLLRCRLKSTAFIVANVTHSSERELFVDIMRMNQHKRTTPHRNITSSVVTDKTPPVSVKGGVARRRTTANVVTGASAATPGGPSDSADVTIATDTRGTVLCSFSVPWATRVTGYPMQRRVNASNLDMWASADAQSNTPSASAVDPVQYPRTPAEHSTYLCVPNVRPLHPQRAEVGMPMLLEFIEHHLQLGFTHIALGLALDW